MNNNTKNTSGGWILCPSKTFLGKFYYFNVLNGEAAWSLDDAEKKIIKHPIPRVHESHHPEPTSPLIEPLVPLKNPKPVFGQSCFTRQPEKVYVPIHIELPIVDQKPSQKPKIKWDFNKDIFINATGKPLTNRFVNYENPIINFDKDNKVQNVINLKSIESKAKATKTIALNTEFPITNRPKKLIKEAVFNIEVPSETAQVTEPNLHINRVQSGMMENDIQSFDTQNVFADMPSETPIRLTEPNVGTNRVQFGIMEDNTQNFDRQNIFADLPSKNPVQVTEPDVYTNRVQFSMLEDDIQNLDGQNVFADMPSKTPVQLTKPNMHTNRVQFAMLEDDISHSLDTQKVFPDMPSKTLIQVTEANAHTNRVQFGIMEDNIHNFDRQNIFADIPSETPVLVTKPNVHTNRVQFGMLENDIDQSLDRQNRADLRNLLLAKKRKTDVGGFEIDNKKPKMVKEASPKKKVSFNLDNDVSSYDNEMMYREKYSVTMRILRELAGNVTEWYIIVDSEILMDEFSFIEKLVQFDQDCKLVVPCSVVSHVCAESRAGRATVARSVLRRLDAPHIIVLPDDVMGSKSPHDDVLSSCMDALNRNIHVVLITKDLELLTASKCYPIHSYHINTIKNGLAPKPKYKQNLKITICNTEANVGNGDKNIVVHEDKNNKEYVNQNKVNLTSNYISNVNSGMSNENSNLLNKYSFHLRPTQNPLAANWNAPSKSNLNAMNLRENSINLIENSEMYSKSQKTYPQDTNTLSLNHLYNTTKDIFNSISKESIEKGSNTKNLTDWRSAISDVTETTIEMDMQNLKINIKNKNGNEKFITSTLNQTFKNRTFNLQNSKIHKWNFQFENKKKENSIQNSNVNFQIRGNEDSNFVQKSIKEPQFKNGTDFEDVFKMPVNRTKNASVDLSKLYVKNKVMENRLKERMDEFVCSYKQIMEEFLTNILQGLPPSILKCMTPPWSLYEAIQCAKNVYKDHVMVKEIVKQISGYLYETDSGMDKMKMNITPNDFMKVLGCGIHLINYMKKILPPSTEMLDSEKQIMEMLEHVENPLTIINEPLVKSPVDNTDCKEIKQNFVKNRTDIVKYLKKHYPEWQNYEENDNTKIVRTFGRNLNMLILERGREEKNGAENSVVANNAHVDNVGTNNAHVVNVGNGNVDVVTKNAHIANVDNVNVANKVIIEKFATVRKEATKNVGVFVMKEIDSNKIETEKVKIKESNIKQNDPRTINIEKIENAKKKSIFDYVIPKDMENKEQFKIDSEILDVKISVPNIIQRSKDNNRIDNQSFNKDDSARLMNKNDNNKNQERNTTNNSDMKTGIKIVRNVYLIKEFENRLKNNKNLYLDGLEYSIISDSFDETIKNNQKYKAPNNQKKVYEGFNKYTEKNSHNLDENKDIGMNGDKTNKNSESNTKTNQKYKAPNDQPKKIYEGFNKYTENNSHSFYENKDIGMNGDKQKTKVESKIDVEHRDDTTDSGFSNASSQYVIVKTFTTELQSSLELINAYIDGSLQEIREGKLYEKTKNTFRLKAFEANFLITKIMSRLKKLLKKDNCEKITKNVETIMECLERAQVLQKSLNTILTVSNESGCIQDINSSMSLNLST